MKFCFVAGTPVLMAAGYTKAIENIRAGDMVKSYDEANGKIENKRVLSTSVNTTDEVVKVITSDGDEIVATPGHPFYANGVWTDAIDLRAGDILVNVNGEKVIVEQVSHEILESPVKVYNFEVADNHTYLVGSTSGVVVHNTACNRASAKQPNSIKYYAPGKPPKLVTAELQPDGFYLAKDISQHGGSIYKKLEMHGNKYLKLIGDADAAGKLIINKHSSQANRLFEIIKKIN